MDQNERVELYTRLVKLYGVGHQMDVAVEEMAELTNAIMKLRRHRASSDDVITEIADVVVCMEQLALRFGVDAVMAEKERKLQRLKERVDLVVRDMGLDTDADDEDEDTDDDGDDGDTCDAMEDESSEECEETERPSTAASETDV